MSPEQIDRIMSKQPSWTQLQQPVPVHHPGDSTPKRASVYPGDNPFAVHGNASSGGGGLDGYEPMTFRAVLAGETLTAGTFEMPARQIS